MLQEYALEPALLNSWDRFRYFVEKFGISQGRFISRFPKTWKKMVYESLTNCGDVERKRIETRLQQIDDRLLPRPAIYNPIFDWLRNAETEHAVNPFHAIIAGTNPRNHALVLDAESLDDTNPLWNCPASRTLVQRAPAMVAAIRPLLEWCSEIVFVDPHFGPENGRHRATFEAFLAVLTASPRRSQLARVEFHTGDKATATFFQSECQRRLPELVKAQTKVRLVRWRQIELHNRFILTDIGGLLVGRGLDEDQTAEPLSDDYSRLDESALRAHWSNFVTSPAYTFTDDLIIVGTRT